MKNSINIRVSLDRRVKKGMNEEAPLRLVVSRGSSSAMIDLSVSVRPDQWERVNQKVVNHPRARILNDVIEERRVKARRLKDRLEEDGELEGLSITEIKNRIAELMFPASIREKPVRDDRPRFVEHMLKFMSRKSGGTLSVYNQTLVKLKKYKDGIEELKFEEITPGWLEDFDMWMRGTMRSANARNIHFRNIRTVFNDALDEGLISCYPFRKFKIKPEPTPKRSLTVDELRKVFTMDVEPYAEFYRDMFKLIFFLIGINAVDLYWLERIERDGRIYYNRAKTHKGYSIKVEPEARALIEKWRGEDRLLCISERWSDHTNFIRQMNKALRRMGSPILTAQGKKGLGLFPEITSYWARHTWATIAADLDIPDAVISQALGHSGENRVTDIYIRRNMRKVDEANRKVIDYVLGASSIRN